MLGSMNKEILDEEISQGNTIKTKACYHYRKQGTYQQEQIKPCIFVIFAIKKYKSQPGLKRHQKNFTQLAKNLWVLLSPWKTH